MDIQIVDVDDPQNWSTFMNTLIVDYISDPDQFTGAEITNADPTLTAFYEPKQEDKDVSA